MVCTVRTSSFLGLDTDHDSYRPRVGGRAVAS